MSPQPRRVAVTGMGAVTPSGLDTASTWTAVRNGISAIARLRGERLTDSPVHIGGEVRGFDPGTVLPASTARRVAPALAWSVCAADEALRQAGIAPAGRNGQPVEGVRLPWPAHRFAIIAATGSGPVDAMQQATLALHDRGPRAVPWSLAVHGGPDAAAALLSIRYGAQGPTQAVSATCASGAVGLGTGLRWLRHGYADAVLVLGVDDCLNPVNLASNANLRSLATGYDEHPEQASRPFDRERTGFVMSSGAAAILLEAQGVRGGTRPALAELAGFGASSDAYHPTSPRPDGSGAALAVQLALRDAGIRADQVDFVNAHGTGTQLGDAAEIEAMRTVFGDRATTVPISATKSGTGHLLGAAGVLEAMLTVQSLREQVLPPTLNLDHSQYPEWDIVAGQARPVLARTGLSSSFGFGGHNGAVVLRACNGEGFV